MATLSEEEKKDGETKLFSSALLRILGQSQTGDVLKENLLASPYSVLVAMSLLIPGSARDTLSALSQVLFAAAEGGEAKCFALLKENKALAERYSAVLSMANRIWVNDKFELHSDYAKALGKLSVPLAVAGAAEVVNKWVRTQTRDKITELVKHKHFGDDFRVCITNAIYFKGKFENAFDESLTKSGVPFLDKMGGTQKSRCQMMSAPETRQLCRRTEAFTFVALPYEGADIHLVLALPNSNHYQSAKCEEVAAMKFSKTEINLFVPKFKFESEFDLIPALSAMGLPMLFGDDCDVSRMVASGEALFVQNVIHKAMIEVDEVGTVAAAATASMVYMTFGCALTTKAPVPVVRFDRPFDFFIVESKLPRVLFGGTVLNPQTSALSDPGAEGL